MVLFLFTQKAEDFHLRAVEIGRLHGINARGVDARVAEELGKAQEVLMHRVIRPREKVAEVMRKDLLLRNVRLFAKCLHRTPDIEPV